MIHTENIILYKSIQVHRVFKGTQNNCMWKSPFTATTENPNKQLVGHQPVSDLTNLHSKAPTAAVPESASDTQPDRWRSPTQPPNPPYLHKPLNLVCNCAPSDARTGENKCPNDSPASLLSLLRPVDPATHFIRVSSRDSCFNPLCLSSSKSSPTKSQSTCFLYTQMKKSLSERKP